MYEISKAMAKINLYLSILGKRKDGFHNLESVMVPINIYDEIVYSVIDEDAVHLSVHSCDYKELLFDYKENIIYKTALLLKNLYKVKKGIKIILKKNIPIGAGLGGGSSDAAQTIKSLSKLWDLNLSTKEMINIADRIGKDVPFFISNKSMIVRETGNILTPINVNFKIFIAIIYPNFSISTKESYTRFKSKSEKNFSNIKNLIIGLKKNNIDIILSNLYNEFELSVTASYPVLCKIKDDIIKINGNCLLCGSGSCMMTVLRDEKVDIINKLQSYCVYNKFKLMFCWNI